MESLGNSWLLFSVECHIKAIVLCLSLQTTTTMRPRVIVLVFTSLEDDFRQISGRRAFYGLNITKQPLRCNNPHVDGRLMDGMSQFDLI